MSEEKTKREPLLSDEKMREYSEPIAVWSTAHEIRDFYEAKITSGDLMVVKTVHRVETQETEFGFLERCSNCEVVICPMDKFCPSCGARIIE
jgi:rRNA maturation endonuclease Nob1